MSDAFNKSWVLLKNEGLARETQAYRREMADQRMEDQGFKQSAPPPRDAEAILRDLYYAGMIMGAGGAGGAEGGQNHPMAEELSQEVMQMFGLPEEGHPEQYQGDEESHQQMSMDDLENLLSFQHDPNWTPRRE